MLIERDLLVSEIEELNLLSKYTIIYLEGSPENRRSHISCLEDSLFLVNLDSQNPKNNFLQFKLSFEGILNPLLFKRRDYACLVPDIYQFILESDESKKPYISVLKLASWINLDVLKKEGCAGCSISRTLGKDVFCPIVSNDNLSKITFGVYFTLNDEECNEYISLRDSGNLGPAIVGVSLANFT